MMLATKTLAEEILDLRQERRAILLAHHYQEPEIQELADWVGDSLELARKARDFAGPAVAAGRQVDPSFLPLERCHHYHHLVRCFHGRYWAACTLETDQQWAIKAMTYRMFRNTCLGHRRATKGW